MPDEDHTGGPAFALLSSEGRKLLNEPCGILASLQFHAGNEPTYVRVSLPEVSWRPLDA